MSPVLIYIPRPGLGLVPTRLRPGLAVDRGHGGPHRPTASREWFLRAHLVSSGGTLSTRGATTECSAASQAAGQARDQP